MDEFRFVSRFITIKLAGINPSQIMQIQKRKTGPVLWSRLLVVVREGGRGHNGRGMNGTRPSNLSAPLDLLIGEKMY